MEEIDLALMLFATVGLPATLLARLVIYLADIV